MDAGRRRIRYNKRLFRSTVVRMACFDLRSAPRWSFFPSQTRMSPMLETNPIHTLIKDLSERTDVLRGYL
ncbi:hypothetical protein GCM10017767_29080 [Halomonas urumqiensis]|nr:hypothetical protein GCM10017767_29080 [Halomonas urumqiensis]